MCVCTAILEYVFDDDLQDMHFDMHTSHVQSDAFAGYTRIVGGHLQSLSVCSLVTRSVRSFIYVHLYE